eukprot:scaffold337204_cov23-Prasinocladus_malaysianus.AAC.1
MQPGHEIKQPRDAHGPRAGGPGPHRVGEVLRAIRPIRPTSDRQAAAGMIYMYMPKVAWTVALLMHGRLMVFDGAQSRRLIFEMSSTVIFLSTMLICKIERLVVMIFRKKVFLRVVVIAIYYHGCWLEIGREDFEGAQWPDEFVFACASQTPHSEVEHDTPSHIRTV